MKKILIVDDHPAIRDGLRLIIKLQWTEVHFGEASDYAEAMKKVSAENWDLVILDMDMPGRGGLEVLLDMRAAQIPYRVLIYSLHDEDQLAVRAMKAGAHGYLSKNAEKKEIITAIETVAAGKKYITPKMAEMLLNYIADDAKVAPHEKLSEREYETMLLIASGKTISEIAGLLSLSVTTVSTYRARILEKLGVDSSAAIVNYAYKNNLIK